MQPLEGNRFRFACNPRLACFTKCCAKLDLVLTPYDVLRLKNRLGLSSGLFLKTYTRSSLERNYGFPIVHLNMNDDAEAECPFVGPRGCTVYADRPGACRIYPVGRAASKIDGGCRTGEYYFMVREVHCLGFKEDKEWEIREWVTDQGVDHYNAMNDHFLEITAGRDPRRIKTLDEAQLKMYYTACYSLDEFRRFIFGSSFLDRFDIEQEVVQRIKTDDVELMKFSSRWLKYSLFGENTLLSRPPNPVEKS